MSIAVSCTLIGISVLGWLTVLFGVFTVLVGYLQDILTQRFVVRSRSHCLVDWLFGIRDDQAN